MQTWGVVRYNEPGPELTQSSAQNMRFTVSPVSFNTSAVSTSYLTRATQMTSAANGQLGIASLWFLLSSRQDGVSCRLYHTAAANWVTIHKTSADRIRIYAYSSVGSTAAFDITSCAAYVSTSGWHHMMYSFNTANTSGTFGWYIDGSSVQHSVAVPFANISAVSYLVTAPDVYLIGVGNPAGPSDLFYGDMANFYFNWAEYLDLNQSSNRVLFRTAQGQPADMGPNGQTPTGNRPIMYFQGPAANWGTNYGYGGNFTVAGTFLNSTSVPGG